MNLSERLKLLEAHGGEFHEYAKQVIFRRCKIDDIAEEIDKNFEHYWRLWQQENDSIYRTAANVLLQTMAVINTHGYRARKNSLREDNLGELALKLDIPEFTPIHLQALVDEGTIIQTKFKRFKSRVRVGLSQAQYLMKCRDDRYSTLVDYLEKLYAILTKNDGNIRTP